METLIKTKTGESEMTISNLYARDAALDSDLDDEINALAFEMGLDADDDRDLLLTIIEEG